MIRSRGIRFGQAGGQAVFGAFHDAGPSCFPNISDKTVVTFRKGW
ncbi:hypothetical protein [Sinisalibacter aestuarii]|nr:hypothetical protein [Sinisalibacter aestuarii]